MLKNNKLYAPLVAVLLVMTMAACNNERRVDGDGVFPPKGTGFSLNLLQEGKGVAVTGKNGQALNPVKEDRQGKPVPGSKLTIERYKVNPCFIRVCSEVTGCKLYPVDDKYCE